MYFEEPFLTRLTHDETQHGGHRARARARASLSEGGVTCRAECPRPPQLSLPSLGQDPSQSASQPWCHSASTPARVCLPSVAPWPSQPPSCPSPSSLPSPPEARAPPLDVIAHGTAADPSEDPLCTCNSVVSIFSEPYWCVLTPLSRPSRDRARQHLARLPRVHPASRSHPAAPCMCTPCGADTPSWMHPTCPRAGRTSTSSRARHSTRPSSSGPGAPAQSTRCVVLPLGCSASLVPQGSPH